MVKKIFVRVQLKELFLHDKIWHFIEKRLKYSSITEKSKKDKNLNAERGILMILEEKKIIEYHGEKYMILSILEEKKEKYAFANKLNKIDLEPTDEYCIFKKENNEIRIITDQQLIYPLLAKFQKKIKKNIESIISEGDNIW